MIYFSYTKEFQKSFDDLSPKDQQLVLTADQEIRAYCETHKAPFGLRIKKLHQTAAGSIFEGRVNISIRTLWARHGNEVSFIMLGDHDTISKYLKNL